MKKIVLILLAMLFTASLAFGQTALDENFESGTWLPTGWTQQQIGDRAGWSESTTQAHSPTRSAFHNDDDVTTGCNDWLITPVMDLSTYTTPQLAYWEYVNYGSYAEAHNVKYSTDYSGSGDPTLATWTLLNGAIGTEDTWVEKGPYNLPASATVYVAFQYTGDYASEWWIDDVTVAEAPSCPDPSDQTESSITNNSASLGWTENGTATSWDIELGAAGFSPTGTPTQSGVTNPYTYGSLTANTSYDWYVRADCGGGDYSNWVGASTFTTLCDPFTATFSENFDGVSTPDLPDCWSKLDVGGSSWTYVETSTTNSYSAPNNVRMYNSSYTDLAVTYLLLITPELSDLTTQLNQIRFYAASGELCDLIVGTMSDPADETTFTTYQTINLTAAYTEYTVTFGSGYTGTDKFIAFRHGLTSTYDYLNIDNFVYEPIPSCPAPSALTNTNITQTTADLGWTENGTATSWDIEWGATPYTFTGTPTITGITNNPYTLNPPLSPGTEYTWKVRADCGAKATSTWAGPATFTTASPGDNCANPISITLPAALPYTDASQTTCGRVDDYSSTCLGNYDGGEDIIYELTVTTTTVVDITLDPKTTTYTGICIDDACPPGDPCIDKSTNSSASAHGMTGVVLAAGTYYIMIDTYPSPTCIPDFDLSITDASPTTPPNCATNPDPSDTETNVQVNANLSWSDGGGIPYGYKIFFGTDNPPTNIENGTDLGLVTTYDPASDMDYSTIHYWKIVPYNPNGDAAGCSVWSFTTQDNPNYGSGTGLPLYYFANSTTGASVAPSQPTYNWVDISTTGTDVIGDLSDDNFVGPYPIGFTFNFFGNDYTEFYINSNGMITFGSGSSSRLNATIPTTGTPNDFIAWFWDDLRPNDPDVLDQHCYYGNSGGNLVVSFVHYPEYGADVNGWITAQIILKPSGNVKLQYKEKGTTIDLVGCTVGIENLAGDAGVQYLYDGTGGPIFNGAKTGIAVEFGTDAGTLPVEILAGSFQALYTINDAGMEYVTVNWSTVTETDINGFNIYRSYEDDIATAGNHINTSLIPGYGTTTEIHDYAFEDITADVYSTYYYWLEVVDIGGQTNFHGPITFIPEVENPHPNDIPTTMLFGNYPNPVENSTTIRYQIQGPLSAQNATISIYNILGELVRKVDGEDRQAVLDVSELPTGIYFYKLETDTYHSVKKMVIVR